MSYATWISRKARADEKKLKNFNGSLDSSESSRVAPVILFIVETAATFVIFIAAIDVVGSISSGLGVAWDGTLGFLLAIVSLALDYVGVVLAVAVGVLTALVGAVLTRVGDTIHRTFIKMAEFVDTRVTRSKKVKLPIETQEAVKTSEDFELRQDSETSSALSKVVLSIVGIAATVYVAVRVAGSVSVGLGEISTGVVGIPLTIVSPALESVGFVAAAYSAVFAAVVASVFGAVVTKVVVPLFGVVVDIVDAVFVFIWRSRSTEVELPKKRSDNLEVDKRRMAFSDEWNTTDIFRSHSESEDTSARTLNGNVRKPLITSTEALVESKGTPLTSTFSILKIMPVLNKELNKFSSNLKGFAYHFGHDAQLTAYFSEECDKHLTKLKEDLVILLGRHIPAELVKVKVVNSMPTTSHCCGGIGSALTLGNSQQHVGLYLTYEGSDSIYWLSSAHGYVQELRAAHPHAEGPDHCLRANERNATPVKIRIQNAAALPGVNEVDVHILYLAYNYNPVPITHSRRILDGISKNLIANITMCHSVDVLVGPTPLTVQSRNHNKPYMNRFTSAFNDHRPLLRPVKPYYKITSLRLFDFILADNCLIFDTAELSQQPLICYLGGPGQLARGTVIGLYSGQVTLPGRNNPFVAQNMLLIRPTDNGQAASGHSGSVWVQKVKNGSGYEAVAVTSAIVRLPDQPGYVMWLAIPLCACLLALCEENPKKFCDYTRFDVVR